MASTSSRQGRASDPYQNGMVRAYGVPNAMWRDLESPCAFPEQLRACDNDGFSSLTCQVAFLILNFQTEVYDNVL
jgi:hypothetical protein